MATKLEDIWTEVTNILTTAKTSGTLTYVKDILQGVREDVPLYPIIVLEPKSESEARHTVPRFIRNTFGLSIICWIEAYKPDKQIVGEANDKGILDIVRDVKNVLNAYPNLNGKAIKFEFPTTTFGAENWPYRYGSVEMSIEYLCKDTER